MERREKLLAGGLGTAVLLWGGLGFYDNNIKAPLELKEQALITAEQNVRDSRDKWKAMLKSQKQVRDAVSDSLPPDPQDAQRVYLKWVMELAELSHWKEVKPPATLDPRAQLGKIGVRVPITLTAKARMKDVATFLWHFERTDLQQRVSAISLTSPSSSGDPEFTVVATLEGLSLSAAPSRKRLFPEAELNGAIDDKVTSITVTTAEGFPSKTPFRVKIGGEFATVTAIEGQTWTIQRGVDQTPPTAHSANASVEYAPFRAPQPGHESLDSYAALLTRSGFLKPVPLIEFKPKLASTTLPALTRGEPWPAELKVESWSPAWPAPAYELVTPPVGLKLNGAKLEWEVPAETKAGDYKFKLLARAGEVTKIETELTVTLKERNRPPKFEPVAKLQAFVGQPLTFPVVAKDEDPGTSLTYALAGTIPAGMTIDARTGTISWTPPETVEAAPLAFQVTVTDNGTPPQVTTVELSGQLDDDHAQLTYLVACVDKGESRIAWLFDRLANTKTELKVGDKVKASDLEFAIEAIDTEGIVLRLPKSRQRLELGQHLRQGKILSDGPRVPPPPAPAVPLESPASTARN
jgi:hypothetical protein